MVADYPNDHDHFVVDTAVGPIRIAQIAFLAEFSLTTKSLPPSVLQEYKSHNGERISQSAIFPVEINQQNWAFELHNLGATGETHVLLRRMSDSSD